MHFFQLLLALATIGMAVRFVSGIASGFLVCIVTGIKSKNASINATLPITMTGLSGPYAGTLAAYAAQDADCHDQVPLAAEEVFHWSLGSTKKI